MMRTKNYSQLNVWQMVNFVQNVNRINKYVLHKRFPFRFQAIRISLLYLFCPLIQCFFLLSTAQNECQLETKQKKRVRRREKERTRDKKIERHRSRETEKPSICNRFLNTSDQNVQMDSI